MAQPRASRERAQVPVGRDRVHDQQGVPYHVNSVVRRGMALAMLVILVAGCTFAGTFGSPAPSGQPGATRDPAATDSPATPVPATVRPVVTEPPVTEPPATVTPTEIPGLDRLLGKDGRYTLLLLGVDSRGKAVTGRTDAIMLVTMDPNTGRIAMASVPRDTVRVPIADGRLYGSGFVRINGLLGELSRGVSKRKGLERMVKAMEYMSGVEIDNYAMIGFTGVRALTKTVGGVDVVLDKPLVDLSMHVMMKGKEGLRLKAGRNRLVGSVALAFARTRHTDNDYRRSGRQQELIMAALRKVLKRGPEGLPALLAAFKGRIITDIDFADAPALLGLLERAKLGSFKGYVLGPTKWAGEGDALYTTELKIGVVRDLFRKQFGPVD